MERLCLGVREEKHNFDLLGCDHNETRPPSPVPRPPNRPQSLRSNRYAFILLELVASSRVCLHHFYSSILSSAQFSLIVVVSNFNWRFVFPSIVSLLPLSRYPSSSLPRGILLILLSSLFPNPLSLLSSPSECTPHPALVTDAVRYREGADQ